MNRTLLKPVKALCLIPLAALCLAAAPALAQTAPAGMPSGMKMGADGHDMKASMKMSMDEMQKMKMSGDQDKDFAMMMKMHHQQALKMAEEEVKHGKSPEMKAMANDIIAAQKKEIAQFEQWLAKQK